jgi:hypothetical protein
VIASAGLGLTDVAEKPKACCPAIMSGKPASGSEHAGLYSARMGGGGSSGPAPNAIMRVRALKGVMVNVSFRHGRGVVMKLFVITAVACIVAYMALAGSG